MKQVLLFLIVVVIFIAGGIYLTRNTHISTTNTIMKTEENKLQIIDEREGTGEAVKKGDVVSVHYRGTLEDGTVFDESYKRGQTFSFTVGAGRVIQGWDEGLVGMKVGGKRTLIIPPDMGYGSLGVENIIPPNATLTFEIELESINR